MGEKTKFPDTSSEKYLHYSAKFEKKKKKRKNKISRYFFQELSPLLCLKSFKKEKKGKE